ncbi:hypothetical protein [Rhizobium sp. AAP43]|uniref:hypothetical protein n=1 Tax=Rhizobium sp. AAP43 TaxID=1523420 RepID=UPI0006B8C1FC|nr:hypothetical protein [Rhizobium sp. AAP43]KPF47083.1 hypothetical protein IP76_01945 [Rhizobium sp. AAP43]
MTGTLVSLIDFLGTRQACPCCGAARTEAPKGQPAQWHAHRIAFTCGASFVALGEKIRCEVACPDRSRLAAELWTKEGRLPCPEAEAPSEASERLRLMWRELTNATVALDAAQLKSKMLDLLSAFQIEGQADA